MGPVSSTRVVCDDGLTCTLRLLRCCVKVASETPQALCSASGTLSIGGVGRKRRGRFGRAVRQLVLIHLWMKPFWAPLTSTPRVQWL